MAKTDDDALVSLTEVVKQLVETPPAERAAYTRGFQDGFRQAVGKVFILYADDPCTWPGYREWQRRIDAWVGSASVEPPYPPAKGQPGFQSDADELDVDEEPES